MQNDKLVVTVWSANVASCLQIRQRGVNCIILKVRQETLQGVPILPHIPKANVHRRSDEESELRFLDRLSETDPVVRVVGAPGRQPVIAARYLRDETQSRSLRLREVRGRLVYEAISIAAGLEERQVRNEIWSGSVRRIGLDGCNALFQRDGSPITRASWKGSLHGHCGEAGEDLRLQGCECESLTFVIRPPAHAILRYRLRKVDQYLSGCHYMQFKT